MTWLLCSVCWLIPRAAFPFEFQCIRSDVHSAKMEIPRNHITTRLLLLLRTTPTYKHNVDATNRMYANICNCLHHPQCRMCIVFRDWILFGRIVMVKWFLLPKAISDLLPWTRQQQPHWLNAFHSPPLASTRNTPAKLTICVIVTTHTQ